MTLHQTSIQFSVRSGGCAPGYPRSMGQTRTARFGHHRNIQLLAADAGQTIKHTLNCLMGALKKARQECYDCPDVMAPIVKIPNGKLRFLSFDEERRLLRELDPLKRVGCCARLNASLLEFLKE